MDEKWEYTFLRHSNFMGKGEKPLAELTAMGLEGWEVCGFEVVSGIMWILMKRRLKQ
jgi:hypothetical protein